MKPLRIMGLALLVLFALGMSAASIASAEEGVLPQQGTKVFKIASQGGNATLETTRKESIVCKEVSGEGKFLEKSDQHATGTLTFKGCTALGFAATTLGQASGTISSKVLFLVCLVEPKALLFGVLIEPEKETAESPPKTEHIEVVAAKQLILVKGAVIAHNLSGNSGKEFLVDLEGKEGKQTQALECEILGKKFKHTFESSLDAKEDVAASESAKAVVKYEATVELMDT